ncbi:hypothetical protein [Paracoccus sp. PAR01]|uniref:hypothetical protein n=1 Tax=Paracoccus sp. PAR01 TaxID=2769282 RepID=UPI0017826C29|nr:hypothetical protein [Paracoccus sp. PAR01]MBD9527075.1 hypothetical protein [Paracoccus sp. PAR01]
MKLVGPTLACLVFAADAPLSAPPLRIYDIWYEGCEATCKAFAETIRASRSDVELITRDAQQDKTLLPGFVREARDMQDDLVTTYGTSTTIGTIGTIGRTGDAGEFITDIPVVFMFVSDPIASRIAKSFGQSGRSNMC